MIESIEFTNFKALRKTTLPLSPFTLLLGPNGSGKTSVLQALQHIAPFALNNLDSDGTIGTDPFGRSMYLSMTPKDPDALIEIKLNLRFEEESIVATFQWDANGIIDKQMTNVAGVSVASSKVARLALTWLSRLRVFALDASVIAQSVPVHSGSMGPSGGGLAAVLDDLKDNHQERWESLLDEMRRWLPEYDHIQFDKPQQGSKGIVLRTKKGGHRIPAMDLSQGTLIALALLTLAYLPNPPSLIGLEEIDRALHPRLLRHLQDALYRLSYPESCGENRPPIQVIATTHSPYLLDLYRDHPEEVVLAEKKGLEVEMKRLTDIENYGEILGDSPLSEVWYSGVLGAATVKS